MARVDPFTTLGIEPEFRISEAELRRAWMRRAAAFHPDHAGAMETSAEVNEAFRVLRDPLLRAEALLRRFGAEASSEPVQSPEFLASLMDLRERLDEVRRSCEGIEEIRCEVESEVAHAVARLEGACGSLAIPLVPGAVEQVRSALGILRAYRRVLEHVELAADEAKRG